MKSRWQLIVSTLWHGGGAYFIVYLVCCFLFAYLLSGPAAQAHKPPWLERKPSVGNPGLSAPARSANEEKLANGSSQWRITCVTPNGEMRMWFAKTNAFETASGQFRFFTADGLRVYLPVAAVIVEELKSSK